MKRRAVLRERAEKMARQGFTPERIAKRLGLDRRQVRELLREMSGPAPAIEVREVERG
jgi:hypothetical protein